MYVVKYAVKYVVKYAVKSLLNMHMTTTALRTHDADDAGNT